jgi:hypothetical protein
MQPRCNELRDKTITISLAPEPNPFPTALMELYLSGNAMNTRRNRAIRRSQCCGRSYSLRFYFCHVFPLHSIECPGSNRRWSWGIHPQHPWAATRSQWCRETRRGKSSCLWSRLRGASWSDWRSICACSCPTVIVGRATSPRQTLVHRLATQLSAHYQKRSATTSVAGEQLGEAGTATAVGAAGVDWNAVGLGEFEQRAMLAVH